VIDEVHAGDADITGPKCGEARSHELGLPVWRNSRACKSLRREREKPRTGLCGTGGSLDGFVRARLRNWIRLRERYVLGCIVDLPCAGRYPTTWNVHNLSDLGIVNSHQEKGILIWYNVMGFEIVRKSLKNEKNDEGHEVGWCVVQHSTDLNRSAWFNHNSYRKQIKKNPKPTKARTKA
jgi:hypothetical protein